MDCTRLSEPVRPRNTGCGDDLCVSCYFVQYVHSSNIRFLSDGLLASAFLMLTVVTPYTTSPSRQKAQVYLWSIVIFIMYSVLLSLFRMKNRGLSQRSFNCNTAHLFRRLPLQVAAVTKFTSVKILGQLEHVSSAMKYSLVRTNRYNNQCAKA